MGHETQLAPTYHGDIRITVNQFSKHGHLLGEIVLPDFAYPTPVSLLPQGLVIC